MITICGTNAHLSGAINLLKFFFVKKHISQKYSFQSYGHCPATAHGNDGKAVQVLCLYL